LADYAYMFEAKGIQRYIFASGKLRDVVGASDLVAGLARSEGCDRIGALIDKLELTLKTEFSRQAGGAFCLHSSDIEDLHIIRSHWRLYVLRALPGLEFTEGFGAGDSQISAMQDAFRHSSGIRSNGIAEVLPFGRPVHDYAPMTGRPHVYVKKYRSETELLDNVTLSQRARADDLQNHTDEEGNIDGVALRFLCKKRFGERRTAQASPLPRRGEVGPTRQHHFVFPRNFDPDGYFQSAKIFEDEEANPLFPFRNPDEWWPGSECDKKKAARSYPTKMPEDRRYALVHADLSGLGELFQSFSTAKAPGDNGPAPLTTAKQNLDLASAIEGGITAAAQAATETILNRCGDSHGRKVIPMRPILLGGDDITFIIRADLAVDYTTRLLVEIENRLAEVELIKATRTRLSACAGIAIVRPGTPFLSANMLAESLCKFAKLRVKQGGKVAAEGDTENQTEGYPSAIAFHLQHQTAHEEYEGDIWGEATDADGRVLSANPFGVGARQAELPKTIDQLRDLATAIDQAPAGHGTLRQIQSLINEDTGQATARWRRWLEVGRDGEKKTKQDIANLLGCGENTAPCGNSAAYDALTLIDIGALDPPPPVLTEGAA
jgi:hypothetical protein